MRRLLPPRACSTIWLGLAVALLAGCSGSAPNPIASATPEQIVAASRAAADSAATVHVSGSLRGAGGPLSIDLHLVAGKGGRGHIRQGALDFELIEVGRFAYIKGDRAFYRRLGTPLEGELRGAWLKAKTGGGLAPFASLTNLRNLVDMALTSHGTLALKGTSTIGGKRVVAVGDLASGGTLYVAGEGTPYPVEVRTSAGGGLSFDRWNQPVTLTVPSDAVNVNQLAPRQ